jgi:hypothetical protein
VDAIVSSTAINDVSNPLYIHGTTPVPQVVIGDPLTSTSNTSRTVYGESKLSKVKTVLLNNASNNITIVNDYGIIQITGNKYGNGQPQNQNISLSSSTLTLNGAINHLTVGQTGDNTVNIMSYGSVTIDQNINMGGNINCSGNANFGGNINCSNGNINIFTINGQNWSDLMTRISALEATVAGLVSPP